MPVQTIECDIDGHTVKVQQFFATRGFKIKTRLFKLILPVLGAAVGNLDIKSASKLLDMDINICDALIKLSASLDPDEFLALMMDLLSGTIVDNRPIDKDQFDNLFTGNYFFAYKLAAKAIEANHFFDFGDIGSQLQSKLTLLSPKS